MPDCRRLASVMIPRQPEQGKKLMSYPCFDYVFGNLHAYKDCLGKKAMQLCSNQPTPSPVPCAGSVSLHPVFDTAFANLPPQSTNTLHAMQAAKPVGSDRLCRPASAVFDTAVVAVFANILLQSIMHGASVFL